MVCIVCAIIIFEVISRRFFGHPHLWTYEIITSFYSIHFLFLGAYTLLYRAHVSIDIVYLRFSPRGQLILNIIAYLLFFFPFFSVLLVIGWDLAAISWAVNELTLHAKLPIVVPVLKSVLPLTAALILLQGLSNFTRDLLLLVKGKKL